MVSLLNLGLALLSGLVSDASLVSWPDAAILVS